MTQQEIVDVLKYLNTHEIDYRLESNHCCGYIFYFLDGSVYPRRWMDYALEGIEVKTIAETPDSIIEKAMAYELKKDWKHRVEADTIPELFKEIAKYLEEKYKFNTSTGEKGEEK